MANYEKWLDICMKADNVTSEVLRSKEAKDDLTVKEMREIIRETGEDEYVVVTNDKRILLVPNKK